MARPDLPARVAGPFLFLAKLLAWDRGTWGRLYDLWTGDDLFKGTLYSCDPPGVRVPPVMEFGSASVPLKPRSSWVDGCGPDDGLSCSQCRRDKTNRWACDECVRHGGLRPVRMKE